MAFETLRLMESLSGPNPATDSAMARAAAAERVAERAEEREAEARRDRAAERAELLALQNRAQGDPLGEIRRSQARAADLADQVADLESRLTKAKAKLESCRSSVAFWSDRLLVVEEATQRSAPLDPMEQAAIRAADALREAHEGRMVVERARRSLRQRQGSR